MISRRRRLPFAVAQQLIAMVGVGALVSAACGDASEGPTSPAPGAPNTATEASQVEAASVPSGATRAARGGADTVAAAPMKPVAAASAARPGLRTATPKAARSAPGPAKVTYPPFDGTTIAVIHTANMVGEIEPCG